MVSPRLSLALCASLLGACRATTDDAERSSRDTRRAVLVYLAADNDLAADAEADLGELRGLPSRDDLLVLVQIDRPGGATRLRVGGGRTDELARLGAIDSGSEAALSDFVRWGLTEAGGRRPWLVLWDHGHAGAGLLDDASAGTRLGVEALGRAIRTTDRRFEAVVLDACGMAELGVVRALAPGAERVLAFAGPVPRRGLPYGELRNLGGDADTDAFLSLWAARAHLDAQGKEPAMADGFCATVLDPAAAALVDDALGEAGSLDAAARDAVLAEARAFVPTAGRSTEAPPATDLSDLAGRLPPALSAGLFAALARVRVGGRCGAAAGDVGLGAHRDARALPVGYPARDVPGWLAFQGKLP